MPESSESYTYPGAAAPQQQLRAALRAAGSLLWRNYKNQLQPPDDLKQRKERICRQVI